MRGHNVLRVSIEHTGEMSPEPRVKGLDIINILVEIRKKGNRPISWKDAGATCGRKISMSAFAVEPSRIENRSRPGILPAAARKVYGK